MGIDEETQQYIDSLRLKSKERPGDEPTVAPSTFTAPQARLEEKEPTDDSPTDLMVVRSNKLLEAQPEHRLTVFQAKAFLYLLSKIYRKDEQFSYYRAHTKEFREMLPGEASHVYSELKNTAEILNNWNIVFEGEHGPVHTRFFTSVEYARDGAFVEYGVEPKLAPHLLNLRENFTEINLIPLLQCKSLYSIRLYELLMRFDNMPRKQKEKENKNWNHRSRQIDLSDLRYLLTIGDKEYKKFTNFEKRVIQTAQKELAEHCNLNFDYEVIRQHRTPKAIKFTWEYTKKICSTQ